MPNLMEKMWADGVRKEKEKLQEGMKDLVQEFCTNTGFKVSSIYPSYESDNNSANEAIVVKYVKCTAKIEID